MDDFWGFARYELTKASALLIGFVLFCGCAISGPFGTYLGMGFGQRVLFWAFFIGLGYCIGGPVACYICWRFRDVKPLKLSLSTGIVFLAIVIPLTAVLTKTGFPIGLPTPPTFFENSVTTLFFALFIMGYVYIDQTNKQKRRAVEEDAIRASRPRLYQRLPDTVTSPIVRLSVNDHYVVVYCEDGTEVRLLMRFGDAVNEMEGVEGFCTHRSHWVALRVVDDMARLGSKEFVILKTGDHVPISKTYRHNVIEAVAA